MDTAAYDAVTGEFEEEERRAMIRRLHAGTEVGRPVSPEDEAAALSWVRH